MYDFTINPFVSEAQRRACYATQDPKWDCQEWEEKTPSNLPRRKRKKGKRPLNRNQRKKAVYNLRQGKYRKGRGRRLLRTDPTQTTTLRRSFCAKINRQFDQLGKALTDFIAGEDAFGLKLARNTRYAFHSDPEKIKAFQAWLKLQLQSYIQGHSQEELWKAYIMQGFRKGAGRSFDDVRKRRKLLEESLDYEPSEHGPKWSSKLDFYNGTKEQFLRSSFAQPESVNKVKLLAGRTFDDLQNVTADMSARMSRVLTDGLIQGMHPKEIARYLRKEIGFSKKRAETIARTEIIRAHAEGQLDALEDLGVQQVGVAVEFATADDDAVCPDCAELQGVVLSLEEAHGVIPVHPRCRCAFLPANVDEDEDSQIRDAGDINDAFDKAGIEKKVSSARPKSALK